MIEMAHDYSLETRIRCQLETHLAAGDEPRTLVMNSETWHLLLDELEGVAYGTSYYWAPITGDNPVPFFKGIPILIKDFVADMEVLVGV